MDNTPSTVTALDIISARYSYVVRANNGKIVLSRASFAAASHTVDRLRELGYADAYTHMGAL